MNTRTMTVGTVVACAALALALAGSTWAASGAPNPGAPAVDLDQSLAELVAMPGGPPGVISIVQVGDDVTVHTAGVAEVGETAPPAADDYMRVASVAKAFSGATALALVDKGTLSLDDSIGELLPAQPAAWAAVTLRQLLSHTSGLPDFTQVPALQEAAGASLDVAPPPGQLLTYAADEPLNFPPGTEYRYSAVGLMIESATGRPYTESLHKLVLGPLDLTSTSLPAGTEISAPTFHGYDLGEAGAPVDLTTFMAAGWAWASGLAAANWVYPGVFPV
jgi:D-alanyl-D-alanine carboxypeptidase